MAEVVQVECATTGCLNTMAYGPEWAEDNTKVWCEDCQGSIECPECRNASWRVQRSAPVPDPDGGFTTFRVAECLSCGHREDLSG